MVEGWLESRSFRDFSEKEVTANPFSLPPYEVTPPAESGTAVLRWNFLNGMSPFPDWEFSLQRRLMRRLSATAWGKCYKTVLAGIYKMDQIS
jgi:hypothetical protein